MRWLTAFLLLLLIGLQFRLWVGEGSLAQKVELERAIAEISRENEELKARNEQLAREVEELKSGTRGMEGKARSELGMIKEGETFFQVLEPQPEAKDASKAKP